MKTMTYIKEFNSLSNKILHQILSLRANIFVVEQQCCYQDPDPIDLVATHVYQTSDNENEVIAYLRICPPGSRFKDTSIGRVVTKKSYRGQGLCSTLITETMKHILKDPGITRISLSAQSHLKDFYERHQFHAIGEEYMEDNIPHIKMHYQKPID